MAHAVPLPHKVTCERELAVSMPYWEWEGAKGAGERELYLRGTLEALGEKCDA